MKAAVPSLAVFAYSEELRAHVAHRTGLGELSEDEIRRQSAQLVTRDDVAAVDAKLRSFVGQQRTAQPIVIDSHPVTKESFGFRVTPFCNDPPESAQVMLLKRRLPPGSSCPMLDAGGGGCRS